MSTGPAERPRARAPGACIRPTIGLRCFSGVEVDGKSYPIAEVTSEQRREWGIECPGDEILQGEFDSANALRGGAGL